MKNFGSDSGSIERRYGDGGDEALGIDISIARWSAQQMKRGRRLATGKTVCGQQCCLPNQSALGSCVMKCAHLSGEYQYQTRAPRKRQPGP